MHRATRQLEISRSAPGLLSAHVRLPAPTFSVLRPVMCVGADPAASAQVSAMVSLCSADYSDLRCSTTSACASLDSQHTPANWTGSKRARQAALPRTSTDTLRSYRWP